MIGYKALRTRKLNSLQVPKLGEEAVGRDDGWTGHSSV